MSGAADWLDQHRTHTLIALVLAGVAAVGLSTGVLLGLASGGEPPPRAARTAAGTPTPTPEAVLAAPETPGASPSAEEPSTRADSDVEPGRREDVGYFLAAAEHPDGIHVTFDRVQVRSGGVVNENPRTRELVLSPNATVLGSAALAGSPEPQEIPVDVLLGALGEKGPTTLLDVAYDELGYVVEVREKPLP